MRSPIAIWLALAVTCLTIGCASSQPTANLAEDRAILDQFEDRFGALHAGSWSGEWPSGDSMKFVIDWCRAEYTEYDILQSNGYLQSRSRFAARLCWPGSESESLQVPVYLYGASHDTTVRLWQIPMPIPTHVHVGGAQAIRDHVERLNASWRQEPLEWVSLNVNVLKSGETVELHLLADSDTSNLEGQTITAASAIEPRLTSAWIGTTHGQERFGYTRLALISGSDPTSPTASPGWTHFGIFSSSGGQRRLEGEVSSGSRWKSREHFVRFMQDVQDLDIEGLEDPATPEVQALMRQHLGEIVTVAEIVDDAKAIFGSWEAMIEATCQFAELFHLPVFAFMHDDTCHVLSILWYQSGNSMPERIHAFRGLDIPDLKATTLQNAMTFGRFPFGGEKVVFDETPHVCAWFKLHPPSN